MSLASIRFTPSMNNDNLINALNQNFALLENLNESQTFKDETGTPRIILGRLPDGRYGFIVSRPGVDVNTAAENDLIFSTNNNLFKIVKSGSLSLTMPDIPNGTKAEAFGSVTHNLNYSPLVLAFITQSNPQSPAVETRLFGASSVQAKSVSTSGVTIAYVSEEKVTASATQVTFNWAVSNAAGYAQAGQTATVKYFLLSETAA